MSYTKGYKAFYKTGKTGEGKCRDFLFKEGQEYEIEGELELCSNGFHFCKDLVLTFEYYGSDPELYCFAEVEALGDILYEEPNKHKCATSKIKINRFLSDTEFLGLLDTSSNSGLLNSGNYNSGNGNSGDWNSGNYNSGNYNSGYGNSGNYNSGNGNSGGRNSGNYNSGNGNSGNYNSGYGNSGNYNSGGRNSGGRNSGNYNSGYGNSGNYNSGNGNSGNYNSGNYNSGYGNSGNYNSGGRNSGNWNSGNRQTGHFNTVEPETINVFNSPCNIDLWNKAKKPNFLYFSTLEGKTYKESFQESFKSATDQDIKDLKALPNFDAQVFFDISGIDLR